MCVDSEACVTGDTVQQAADVSKPTTSAGRAIDNSVIPQAPHGPDTSSDAVPGQADKR
jgi:hypothetical protein